MTAAILAALILAALLATLCLPAGPPRYLAAALLGGCAPGLGFVPLLVSVDAVVAWALVVTVSLAVDVCVAQADMYAAGLSWRAVAVTIASTALIGCALQVAVAVRRHGRS